MKIIDDVLAQNITSLLSSDEVVLAVQDKLGVNTPYLNLIYGNNVGLHHNSNIRVADVVDRSWNIPASSPGQDGFQVANNDYTGSIHQPLPFMAEFSFTANELNIIKSSDKAAFTTVVDKRVKLMENMYKSAEAMAIKSVSPIYSYYQMNNGNIATYSTPFGSLVDIDSIAADAEWTGEAIAGEWAGLTGVQIAKNITNISLYFAMKGYPNAKFYLGNELFHTVKDKLVSTNKSIAEYTINIEGKFVIRLAEGIELMLAPISPYIDYSDNNKIVNGLDSKSLLVVADGGHAFRYCAIQDTYFQEEEGSPGMAMAAELYMRAELAAKGQGIIYYGKSTPYALPNRKAIFNDDMITAAP